MAMVSCGSILWPDPSRFLAFTSISTAANYQINGSGHRAGLVFQIPKTGTITKAGLRIHTCASAVTSRIGLYTVDGSGNPTTTLYGGSNYATFTPAANTYSSVTLGTSASATGGDLAALMVDFDSTAGDMFISLASGTANPVGFPYQVRFNGSTWAKSSANQWMMCHIAYSGDEYEDIGAAPFTGLVASATYQLNTAGADEYALRLTPGFKARVAGLWTSFHANAGGSMDAVLYEGTTAVATQTFDQDMQNPGGGAIRILRCATPYTITAGTTIRAAIKPTTTTVITYRNYTTHLANQGGCLGLPSDACQSTRVDSGSWSDSTTTIPGIGLVLDRLDDGAGGAGGLLRHPGMSGGAMS